MARRKQPQPYQLGWDGSAKTVDDLNKRLSTQFQRIGEMFQELYTNAVQVEEGVWSPVDVSGDLLTFNRPTGRYIKIGSLVIATCYIQFPTTAATAPVLIGGLPFDVQPSIEPVIHGGVIIYSDETTAARLYLDPPSRLRIYSSAGVSVTNATMSNNVFYAHIIYRIND